MKKVKNNNVRKEIQFLAALVVVAILGLLIWSYMQNMNQTITDNSNNQTQVNPTGDWKSFTNNKMKLSFKYPKNWELNKIGESESFQQYLLTFEDKNSNSVTVDITPERCDSNSSCTNIPKYPKFKSLFVFEAEKVDEYRETKIDSVDALSFIYRDFPIGSSTSDEKIYTFVNNGITYNITYYEQKGDEYLSRADWKYLSVVNNIISSIKLK